MKVLILLLTVVLYSGQAFGQKAGRVKVVEFNASACDRTSDVDRIKPRIISLQHLGDTLAIEIGFATGCCHGFIPNIKYLADTLYVRYDVKEDACAACICCYSFSHKILGISSSKLTVKLYDRIIELSAEKYWTYEPTFTLVDGDTINYTDKYRRKQGIWPYGSHSFNIYKDDRFEGTGNFYEEGLKIPKGDSINQKDERGLKQGIWTTGSDRFIEYKDGKIEKIGYRYTGLKVEKEYNHRTRLFREFYRNGKLKKECYEPDMNCRQWDANGVEIK